MTDNRKRFRVLVDWDNDGFVNRGVPEGAPPNLLPYPAYSANLFPKKQPTAGTLVDAEFFEDISELGILAMDISIENSEASYIGADISSFSDNFTVLGSPYVLQANTDYILSFYVYSSENLDISISRTELVSTTVNLVDSVTNLDSTADYTLVTFNIPDEADASGFLLEFTRNGGGNCDIFVKGVMLTAGTQQAAFNTGELAGYDNISEFVLTASWELGRNKWDDPIAYEGTARINVNNDSKRFSPAYTSSPLYGRLNQNLLIVLEYEESLNTWVRLWTGWTSQFKTMTGRTGTRQAEIICQQGIYRLRDGDLDFELTENMTINEAILAILNNSGFRSAYYPLITTLNFDARLGWNSWIQDAEELFTVISPAFRYMELAGFGWGRKTSPAEAIEEMLKAEHSKLYIDRDGGLVLKHREDYVNQVADWTLNFGTDVQSATYRFGEDIINHVDVFVKPRKEVTNEVVWTTKEPIFIAGHPFGDGRQNLYTKYVEMHFEFEEGTQRSITSIDAHSIKDMDVTVYNRNPRLYANPTPYEVPQSEWDGEVHATVLGSDSLRKRLQVRNNLEYNVWIDIAISGDYLEGGEGGVWTVDDLDSQELIRSVQTEKIELPSATTEIEATSYGNFVLHRKSTPIGEFTDMLVKDNSSIKIGDVISITEEQTGEANRMHVVIGESGDYSSGMVLEIVHKLARLDEQRYFHVDDTMTYSTRNVIPNMLDEMLIIAGDYDPVGIPTPEGSYARKYGGFTGAMLLFCNTDGILLGGGYRYNLYNAAGTETLDKLKLVDEGYHEGYYTENGSNATFPQYHLDRDYTRFNTDYLDYAITELGTYFFRVPMFPTTVAMDARFVLVHSGAGGTVYTGATLLNITDRFVIVEDNHVISSLPSSLEYRLGLRTNSLSGFSYMTFGDVTALRYEGLPTEELALEADVLHYFTVWAIAERDYDMNVKIIAADGSILEEQELNFVAGDNKLSIQFTPQSGIEDAHAIVAYSVVSGDPNAVNQDHLYIYGIAITTAEPDTYKETNDFQNDLPVLYL